MALHSILQHLDCLYCLCTSAVLRDKISQLNAPDSMCRFIMDFLTDRWQFLRLGRQVSDKAQQNLYVLQQLKFHLLVKILVNFYMAIIKSILTFSITVWFATATDRDEAKLQCVIQTVRRYRGVPASADVVEDNNGAAARSMTDGR